MNRQPNYINAKGDKAWLNNGQLHRDDDLPAVIKANADQIWYQNGKCHRDNRNGEDQPAIICANGDRAWFQNGERHRENDKPAIIWNNGDQEWWKNNNFHSLLGSTCKVADYWNGHSKAEYRWHINDKTMSGNNVRLLRKLSN